MKRNDWIKAGLYIGVLVVLACIGVCGCGSDDGGLFEETNTDAGADARPPKHPGDIRLDAAAELPRWKTGKIPEQCEAAFLKRWGYIVEDCTPDYHCWEYEGPDCFCKTGPTCAKKADRQYASRNCICTGMPGDWDGSKL